MSQRKLIIKQTDCFIERKINCLKTANIECCLVKILVTCKVLLTQIAIQ